MKTFLRLLPALILCVSLLPAHAQKRAGGAGGMSGPVPNALQFNGAMGKLFGEHKAFTATLDVDVRPGAGPENITMPTTLAFLDGMSRVDLDLSKAKGSQIPAGMAEQFKAMGIAEMTMISREDKQVAYVVYPGLQSFAELKGDAGSADASKIKVETSELGKETIDGQACVKNKVTVTDAAGKATEATVWQATGLKKFPVRIETAEGKGKVVMKLSNVKFEKPDAKLFDAPTGLARYENVETMVQEQMMKKILGGAGAKPGGGTKPGK